MLFDTLKFHGAAFTTPFWTRIFDSVLLPIFDHVRAEVRWLLLYSSIIWHSHVPLKYVLAQSYLLAVKHTPFLL